MNNVLEYVSNRLKEKEFRHEIHKFDSGAVMIDIWKDDLFYVVQIDEERTGLSLVDEDSGFDPAPDKSYTDFEKFRIDFEKIVG